MNVIKKSGKNLIEAADKIKEILDHKLKNKVLPSEMKVSISGDMSRFTRNTLEELNNTEIIGVILVVLVLMFFMGFNNAFFVALSVPLSMFVAYMIMPGLGFTMNMIVMFGFIFALGIIVDDAIVVIENTHRIHRTEKDIRKAAKMAAGEVFLPILSGTLTTLAPFFPLAFWPGIVGKFMYFMPVTLILSLFASLFVAYVINPVFAVDFMKHDYDKPQLGGNKKRSLIIGAVIAALAVIFHLAGLTGLGNFMVFAVLLFAFFQLVLKRMIYAFQNKLWPWFLNAYEKQLRFFTRTRNAYFLLYGITGLFIFTIFLLSVSPLKVLFFPDNMPNTINVYIKMPIGTHQNVTDSVTKIVEGKVKEVLGANNPIVESVIANVGVGAGEDTNFDRSFSPQKGKVSINFVEYKYRNGVQTTPILDSLRKNITGIPGAEITVEKNTMGPPTGKPINIEVSSENLDELITESERYRKFLDSLAIPGVALLKSDFQENKPEILINIDRERAQREGISTGQVGMELRTAIFGKEISKYKDMEDEYPIQLRFTEKQRQNVDLLLNTRITYRDMNSGVLRQIPLSSVASIDYSSSYGGIKRKNMKRVITLYSDVLSGYSANAVLANISKQSKEFQFKEGIQTAVTGEQESQKETSDFLGKAMLISLGLIFFILITQFKSFSKTLIILSEVLFASIGVLLGYIIFRMDVSIIMTGLGIVALGGIVVRNGILIVEFIDVLKERGLHTREAIIQAGKTRITPVVLTATATMLGLVPLALGMNINFITLFTELDPQIHFGGDNVMFWGPLSWAIIFGLSFATFLTLIFVPSMILIDYDQHIKMQRRRNRRKFLKSQKMLS